MNTVLFLCTGNYYRSRYAEILFNWTAPRRGLPWKAESRGLELYPLNPGPISAHTLAALERLGIPADGHLRPPLAATERDFKSADHVVAVKHAEHHPLVGRLFPEWLDRVEFWHVHDVDCCGPDQAIPELHDNVMTLIDRLAQSRLASPNRRAASSGSPP